MNRQVAERLLETAIDMLAELNVQRASLVDCCTVNGDLAEAEASDRAYIENMDRFLDRCGAAIQAAEQALS